jgi:L-fuculokinase
MSASAFHIAALDVGKTNKKLFVYDAALHCLNPDEKGVVLPPVERDGLLCDDAAGVYRWMLDGLADAARRHPNIRAVSISAHGATIALLGRQRDAVFPGDGGLVFPIVSYEQPVSPEEDESFYRDLSMTPEEMQRRTGTARFAWLLNHGRQIHWLKRRFPERFAAVTAILMWPQYLGYLLTGEKGAEPTYLGCHGYLLDLDGRRYSVVAEELGIVDRLPAPPFRATWDVLGRLTPAVARRTGLSPDCLVTMGVHDSNAALVPYFAKGFTDFVVQDSGTWIVTMSPRREAVFEDDELGKEVFFNRSIYGDPVKTTIFRGGAEFEFYRTRVLRNWAHPADAALPVLREIVARREAFALPSVERGSGLFPQSVARLDGVDTVFRDAATAWAVVDLGLAVQGALAIAKAAGAHVRRVFIEGNVGRLNPVYRGAIAALLPLAAVSFGSLGGAPYGAAILGASAFEGVRPEALADRIEMALTPVSPLDLDVQALRDYANEFIRRASSAH